MSSTTELTYPSPLVSTADVARGFTDHDERNVLAILEETTARSSREDIETLGRTLDALASPRGRAMVKAYPALRETVFQKVYKMSDERFEFYLTLLGLDEGELEGKSFEYLSATLERKIRLGLVEDERQLKALL